MGWTHRLSLTHPTGRRDDARAPRLWGLVFPWSCGLGISENQIAPQPHNGPDTVIDKIALFGRHSQGSFDRLRSTEPIDGAAIQALVRHALTLARTVVEKLPATAFGMLFFENGRIVVPDPEHLQAYRTRRPSQGGIVPRTDAMSVSDMARRYKDHER